MKGAQKFVQNQGTKVKVIQTSTCMPTEVIKLTDSEILTYMFRQSQYPNSDARDPKKYSDSQLLTLAVFGILQK